MFGTNTKTDIEPPPQDVDPSQQLVPLSVIALDLPALAGSWPVYLHERNIPVVVDDLGRDAIARSDARMLITERRENEVRARELAARQEAQAIEQDRQRRAQLPSGTSWHMFPDGVSPAEAWAQLDRDARPRRTSVLQEALTRTPGELTYHSLTTTPDEE